MYDQFFENLVDKYFDEYTGGLLPMSEWDTEDLVETEVRVNAELQRRGAKEQLD